MFRRTLGEELGGERVGDTGVGGVKTKIRIYCNWAIIAIIYFSPSIFFPI